MNNAWIVGAKRSPVIPHGGAFAALDIHDLAAPVIRALLDSAGMTTDQVGELILANALGAGGNPARVAALAAGLPETVGGLSIDRQCCGGLDAVMLAQSMVLSGQHDVVIAGGAESYSRRPLRYRTFADGRAPEPYDQAQFTPWPGRDPDMAEAAEALAQTLGITRQAQDEWAVASHQAALQADLSGQIVTLEGQDRDAFTRNLNARLCARAPVVAGSVTAANMAVAADGAAFVLVVSDRVARTLSAPKIRIEAGSSLGGAPDLPGIAPVVAIKAALDRAGRTVDSLTVAEVMEAFAVQAIACQEGADLPRDIVNPNGGALARGHPIGASGAIVAVGLYHQLVQKGGAGVAAIAAAGGLGSALVLSAV
ncbi:putative acetyl-CoA acyltransferase [Aliiroseovarius pelagivivens]|uniref:Putative acetyl-CoA acyltransferase n=1 Tax=Aliiroseovarius pelagivivens TaxID=1639690 RepID=A0A2R8AM74_9RHOB|nr:thiolase family protein [Aliiroseovarius pelagivivens]SPF77100.1 putative acetyl-CoA acyltransferase [Aliiroseovarius pelagivivens]